MIPTIITFIGSIIVSIPALIVLFLLGVIFEHNNRRGFSVFIGLVTIVVSYFILNVPLNIIAAYAGGYIVIGLLWSFWRYKRFVEVEASKIRA